MRISSKAAGLSLLVTWGTAPVQCAASQDDCAISPRAIVSDACASFSTLERLNEKVRPAIVDLTHETDFFSHYRVNLFHKRCPFWDDEDGMCGNVACAVATLDNEEDIPEVWRTEELSKLEGPRAKHPGRKTQKEKPEKPLGGDLGEDVTEDCVVEYDDECDERDYCVPEDQGASSKGDYVSLVQNPERYTGYAGDGAKQVWESIYRENCFQRSSFPHAANPGQSSWQSKEKGPAAMDFKQILDTAGRQHQLEQHRQQNPNAPFVAQTGNEVDDECIEKRVFYRVMSGMHASIATHLCWDFLNRTTGEWSPNVDCYIHRLHKFPDRISNLYFNYALVTRAIAKIGPYLQKPGDYTFCTGDRDQDADTRAKVLAVTQAAASVPEMFDESLMFQNGEGPSLKEDFKNRFRNVSRLMDCVGCDKCRLWGKLQTAGYGTALKVLFEFDNDSVDIPMLKRTELVALFNTYGKISHSLFAVGQFRVMAEEKELEEQREREEAEKNQQAEAEAKKEEPLSVIPDSAKKPHNVVMPPPEPEESHVENESHKEEPKPKGKKPRTIKDEFAYEWSRFLKATKIVLRSWVSFPSLLWEIVTSELKRLYEFYIGLPVSPRTWKFERPNLDEL